LRINLFPRQVNLECGLEMGTKTHDSIGTMSTSINPAERPRRPRPKIVTLTEAAAARVQEVIANDPSKYLRVGVKNGGCAGMEYVMEYADAPGPHDELVEDRGVNIVIDAKAVLFLLGAEVDFETTALAAKFVFRNPNQTDACGCGESVTLIPAAADA
jgi:iron-sulfur cluster assembly protein